MSDSDTQFDFDATYRVESYSGVAWRAWKWETLPDEDTWWSGYEVPTGKIIAHMVGDDSEFTFDPDEFIKIGDDEYCPECGQIGCKANAIAYSD